ncbi:hypothetical protein FPV67DRAFT_439383 [Lyophyllum atratum]|nr:hypothetical protein FPV67DRAFT_439383 [Lyophyllum atratum]
MNSMKRKQDDDNHSFPAQKKPRPETEAEPSPSPSSPATTTDSALQQALDFSALNDTSSISERFDLVGRALLHEFHLVVRSDNVETLFEILELEFYLLKDGCHEDPFTHGSEEQKLSGRWYFHRAPRPSADSHRSSTSLTAYRGGTRKGMDLTLGGPAPTTSSPYFGQPSGTRATSPPTSTSVRGGALLRSLRRASDSKVISGPSVLVDEILHCSKAADIPELVEQKWSNNTTAFGSRQNSLFLRPRAIPDSSKATVHMQSLLSFRPRATVDSSKPTVYRSPRIGLELSHPGTTASASHPRVIFLSRPYRYFTHPELLTANGRTQTFLGVLHTCLDTTGAALELKSIRLRNELKRITGLSETTCSRYFDHYGGGIDSGKLKTFVGAQGKGAASSPATYLRMMGTLEQYRAEPDAEAE